MENTLNVLVMLSGLEGFKEGLKGLAELPGINMNFFATTGTAGKMAKELKISATTISEHFGPEVLGDPVKGIKVKSLRTEVLASINAKHDIPEHAVALADNGGVFMDVVICKPYPMGEDPSWANIDLGLLTLAAAAKNARWVLPVCSTEGLHKVIKLLSSDGCVGTKDRIELATSALKAVSDHFDQASKWTSQVCGW